MNMRILRLMTLIQWRRMDGLQNKRKERNDMNVNRNQFNCASNQEDRTTYFCFHIFFFGYRSLVMTMRNAGWKRKGSHLHLLGKGLSRSNRFDLLHFNDWWNCTESSAKLLGMNNNAEKTASGKIRENCKSTKFSFDWFCDLIHLPFIYKSMSYPANYAPSGSVLICFCLLVLFLQVKSTHDKVLHRESEIRRWKRRMDMRVVVVAQFEASHEAVFRASNWQRDRNARRHTECMTRSCMIVSDCAPCLHLEFCVHFPLALPWLCLWFSFFSLSAPPSSFPPPPYATSEPGLPVYANQPPPVVYAQGATGPGLCFCLSDISFVLLLHFFLFALFSWFILILSVVYASPPPAAGYQPVYAVQQQQPLAYYAPPAAPVYAQQPPPPVAYAQPPPPAAPYPMNTVSVVPVSQPPPTRTAYVGFCSSVFFCFCLSCFAVGWSEKWIVEWSLSAAVRWLFPCFLFALAFFLFFLLIAPFCVLHVCLVLSFC